MAKKIITKEIRSWICILNFSEYEKEEFKDFESDVLRLCADSSTNIAIDLIGVGYLNSLKIGFIVE